MTLRRAAVALPKSRRPYGDLERNVANPEGSLRRSGAYYCPFPRCLYIHRDIVRGALPIIGSLFTSLLACHPITGPSYLPFQLLLRVLDGQICAFMFCVSGWAASGHERGVLMSEAEVNCLDSHPLSHVHIYEIKAISWSFPGYI